MEAGVWIVLLLSLLIVLLMSLATIKHQRGIYRLWLIIFYIISTLWILSSIFLLLFYNFISKCKFLFYYIAFNIVFSMFFLIMMSILLIIVKYFLSGTGKENRFPS